VRAITLRSKIAAAQGKAGVALETMKTAAKVAPNDPRVLFDLGLAYQNAGNPAQAKVEWENVLKIRPRMAEPLEALANLAIREKDMKSVQTYGNQLIAVRPDLPQGYMLSGNAAAALGDLYGADRNFSKVVELAPNNALGYAKLGAVRIAQKRVDEAGKLFEQGLSKDPNSFEALSGSVMVLVAQKQIPAAITKVQAAVDRVPTSATTTLLGKLYVENKQPGLAETALQKAIQIDPKNAEAIFVLYQLKSTRGAKDEAEALITDSIKNGISDPRLYDLQGMGLEAKGDWKSAEAAYQKTLAMKPDDAMAANNLAYLLLEHGGDVNLAVSLAQTARRGLPKATATADTLAWASFHVGAYDTAKKLLEDSVKEQPANPTYQFHLGMTYLKLGDATKGKAALQKALSLAPQGPHADEIRAQLQ
jgi:tetratricopeptide (TPR) repeat protein